PPAPGGRDPTSILTWKVKVLRTGEFPLRVRSSTGITQTKTISIARPDAPAGGKLALALSDNIELGKTFSVTAAVTNPAPGQTLTLNLPRGLERTGGPEQQAVPPAPGGGKEGVSNVRWQVKVQRPGTYRVRVQSSTGVARSKTVTIVEADRRAGKL